MLQKRRSRRSVRKKIFFYISFLFFLGLLILLLNAFFFLEKSAIISPLGQKNIDIVKVEKSLKDKSILFSDLRVLSDSSYGIKIQNNGEVRISSKKNIDAQLSSLQRILRELTIEGKPFKSIDFRFNEPIISF